MLQKYISRKVILHAAGVAFVTYELLEFHVLSKQRIPDRVVQRRANANLELAGCSHSS